MSIRRQPDGRERIDAGIGIADGKLGPRCPSGDGHGLPQRQQGRGGAGGAVLPRPQGQRGDRIAGERYLRGGRTVRKADGNAAGLVAEGLESLGF